MYKKETKKTNAPKIKTNISVRYDNVSPVLVRACDKCKEPFRTTVKTEYMCDRCQQEVIAQLKEEISRTA